MRPITRTPRACSSSSAAPRRSGRAPLRSAVANGTVLAYPTSPLSSLMSSCTALISPRLASRRIGSRTAGSAQLRAVMWTASGRRDNSTPRPLAIDGHRRCRRCCPRRRSPRASPPWRLIATGTVNAPPGLDRDRLAVGGQRRRRRRRGRATRWDAAASRRGRLRAPSSDGPVGSNVNVSLDASTRRCRTCPVATRPARFVPSTTRSRSAPAQTTSPSPSGVAGTSSAVELAPERRRSRARW